MKEEEKEQEQAVVSAEEKEEQKMTLSDKIFVGGAFTVAAIGLGLTVRNFTKAAKTERDTRQASKDWTDEHNRRVQEMRDTAVELVETRRDWMKRADRIADRLNVNIDRSVK